MTRDMAGQSGNSIKVWDARGIQEESRREPIRETKGAPNINLSLLGAFFVELIMSLTKLFW